MLHKKMLRDFQQHLGQFVSIFLLSFLAIFLFTGVAGEVVGVEAAREKFHAQTHLADGWIYGEDFTDQQVEKIAALDEVKDAQKRYYQQTTDADNNTIFLYLEDETSVNQPLVLEGEAYEPNASGNDNKIWLAKRFAQEQNLAVGDQYDIFINSEKHTLTVAGLIWSSEYEYYRDEVDLEPDYHATGYAFAASSVMAEKNQLANQIVFTCTDGTQSVHALESKIEDILGNQYSVLLDRSGITNLTIVNDEIQQHRMMSILFPTFFVIIAMLTTITTMKRIVDRQRTQIGTLKAIGVSKKKIYLHYLSYGFFPSLAGALLGTLIGPRSLSPMLFKMKYYLESSDEYMFPHFDVVYPLYFWLLALLIVALCTVATWLSCKNILRLAPAIALRPAQPKSGKTTIFEKLPFWNKLSFSARYNLRDISRNKGRTIFGVAGTISCMALLLCGFSAKDNFQNAVIELYINDLMNHSSMITLNLDTPIAEAERIRDMVNGELVMSDTTEIRMPDGSGKQSCHMNVYEEGQIANILDENLEVGKISGDAFTITQKTADLMGISVGDTVQWHIYGSNKWITSTVTMITRAPFEQGIVTTRQVIEAAGYDFTPTRLLSQENVSEELMQESPYIDGVTSQNDLGNMMSNYMNLVNMVMGFMLGLAIILAVIVLYSLGLLSFEERQKEMATLKVLGFQSKGLRNLMLQQNIILSILGAILGIPLGYGMLNILVNSLGDAMDIPTSLHLIYILLSFAITVVVSIVVNLLFSKRIRTMNMVEEIKAME